MRTVLEFAVASVIKMVNVPGHQVTRSAQANDISIETESTVAKIFIVDEELVSIQLLCCSDFNCCLVVCLANEDADFDNEIASYC